MKFRCLRKIYVNYSYEYSRFNLVLFNKFLLLILFLFYQVSLSAQTEAIFLKENIKEPIIQAYIDVIFTDFDSDFYTDFIFEERDYDENLYKFNFMRNTGNFNFVKVAELGIEGFSSSNNIKWFDYDFDGDLDLFYTIVNKLFLQKQECNFSFSNTIKILEVARIRDFELIDLDGDRKAELIVDNYFTDQIEQSKIYMCRL